LSSTLLLTAHHTSPGWLSFGRFSLSRTLAVLPSRELFFPWCQVQRSCRFSKLWSSPGLMWSTSVPLSVHREPSFMVDSHRWDALDMTFSRNCDQLGGSLFERVLPFQLSDTLVLCISNFTTFIFMRQSVSACVSVKGLHSKGCLSGLCRTSVAAVQTPQPSFCHNHGRWLGFYRSFSAR